MFYKVQLIWSLIKNTKWKLIIEINSVEQRTQKTTINSFKKMYLNLYENIKLNMLLIN